MFSSIRYHEQSPVYCEEIFKDGILSATILSYWHVDLTAEKFYRFVLHPSKDTLDGFYTIAECKDALFSRYL